MANPETSPSLSESWVLTIVDASKNRFLPLIKLLEESKINVSHVAPSSNTLEDVIESSPDIVIINLFIEGKSALPLIREIKSKLSYRQTRIIILTAHNSINNIRESIKAGADDFVVEPAQPQLMLERIKYQLQDREFFNPEELDKSVEQPTTSPSSEEIGRSQEGFQLLYDSLRILSENTNNQEALFKVLDKVAFLAQSKRVNLIEGDLESGKGLVAASSDDENLHDLPIDLEKYPEVREVLINGNIVYIKDITQNPLTKNIQNQVKTIQITSLIVFPIRHRALTLGSMNIRLSAADSISDKTLKTFYMVALALGPKLAARKLLRRKSSS